MQIEILYSDSEVVAVNKPPGLSVHETPGPGSSVLRELRKQIGDNSPLFPVHRLDKDASGVLLFARSQTALKAISRLWETVSKTYWVLCEGGPPQGLESGIVDAPILENQTGKPERLRNALRYFKEQNPGREIPPIPPPRTSAVHPAGRTSQTEYRVLEHFNRPGKGAWSWLEIRPRQGRMHQIRVHAAHAGFPLAVDPLYGKRKCLSICDIEDNSETGGETVLLARLPLHAAALRFPDIHKPGEQIAVEAPLPEDLRCIRSRLREKPS